MRDPEWPVYVNDTLPSWMLLREQQRWNQCPLTPSAQRGAEHGSVYIEQEYLELMHTRASGLGNQLARNIPVDGPLCIRERQVALSIAGTSQGKRRFEIHVWSRIYIF